MCPDTPTMVRSQRGSAILIALFVIVIMALLAAAMGRFLVDSSEKHTVEVRGVRALMAAQSGLEIALYRLYPSGQWQGQQCAASTSLSFTDAGLIGCQAIVTCNKVSVSAAGVTQTAYDFSSEGRCGDPETNSGPNPDFAVSRTLVAQTFDGVNP
ncbi:MSHA biogenesis protein MshP [Aeromonas caviae]|uniref:MSHA biogenesis protein MshP n=1 Tax=Aeromonas caviae TaxID=648 RepID=UPI0029DB71DC|nr:MSHA biogenesis protein MshP [Aeromonas caviae]MDX7703476.1 MSHA biogenesis protein MshP [Aeromonas caviae]MDX7713493.1 MSHA biogenesis protein MshP [Aeromonas caviae]MDX7795656.1 MSHA biogenesis protein MshP [Aeromonas caviae]